MNISRVLAAGGLVGTLLLNSIRAADKPETPPAAPVPTVPAAVANLVVLAEDGTQLQSLRTRLQANADRADEQRAVHEAARPSANAPEAERTAWQAKHDELVKRAEAAHAAVSRFDRVTFPDFAARVNEARTDVNRAWAAGHPTAADNKRVGDATTALNAVFRSVQALQAPPGSGNAANRAGS